MKKVLFSACTLFLWMFFFVGFSWAVDFTGMNNQELFEIRKMIKFSTEQVQVEYQEEWDKRLADMSDEEKKKFADAAKNDDYGGDELWVPGKGYEKQQGIIIYGGGGTPDMIPPK